MSDILSPPTELQVSPATDLAGYHYETDVGRYTVFFWQTSSNSLYASILLKEDFSWVPVQLAIPVATDAKKHTPITAVNWSNGLKAAVYYLDDRNNIHERVSGDGGITWRDGGLSALSVPTRSFSDLAAVISWETLNAIHIYLYFQDSQNLIHELDFSVNDGHWRETMSTGYDKLFAVGGTKIACGSRTGSKSVVTQHVDKGVQEFWQDMKTDPKARKWTILSNKNYLQKTFDRGTRLGYSTDVRQARFYAYDSRGVTERIWEELLPKEQWRGPAILPMSIIMAPNFIVLSWPLGIDSSSSEIHLFSLYKSGVLQDYLVGFSPSLQVSLLHE